MILSLLLTLSSLAGLENAFYPGYTGGGVMSDASFAYGRLLVQVSGVGKCGGVRTGIGLRTTTQTVVGVIPTTTVHDITLFHTSEEGVFNATMKRTINNEIQTSYSVSGYANVNTETGFQLAIIWLSNSLTFNADGNPIRTGLPGRFGANVNLQITSGFTEAMYSQRHNVILYSVPGLAPTGVCLPKTASFGAVAFHPHNGVTFCETTGAPCNALVMANWGTALPSTWAVSSTSERSAPMFDYSTMLPANTVVNPSSNLLGITVGYAVYDANAQTYQANPDLSQGGSTGNVWKVHASLDGDLTASYRPTEEAGLLKLQVASTGTTDTAIRVLRNENLAEADIILCSIGRIRTGYNRTMSVSVGSRDTTVTTPLFSAANEMLFSTSGWQLFNVCYSLPTVNQEYAIWVNLGTHTSQLYHLYDIDLDFLYTFRVKKQTTPSIAFSGTQILQSRFTLNFPWRISPTTNSWTWRVISQTETVVTANAGATGSDQTLSYRGVVAKNQFTYKVSIATKVTIGAGNPSTPKYIFVRLIDVDTNTDMVHGGIQTIRLSETRSVYEYFFKIDIALATAEMSLDMMIVTGRSNVVQRDQITFYEIDVLEWNHPRLDYPPVLPVTNPFTLEARIERDDAANAPVWTATADTPIPITVVGPTRSPPTYQQTPRPESNITLGSQYDDRYINTVVVLRTELYIPETVDVSMLRVSLAQVLNDQRGLGSVNNIKVLKICSTFNQLKLPRNDTIPFPPGDDAQNCRQLGNVNVAWFDHLPAHINMTSVYIHFMLVNLPLTGEDSKFSVTTSFLQALESTIESTGSINSFKVSSNFRLFTYSVRTNADTLAPYATDVPGVRRSNLENRTWYAILFCVIAATTIMGMAFAQHIIKYRTDIDLTSEKSSMASDSDDDESTLPNSEEARMVEERHLMNIKTIE